MPRDDVFDDTLSNQIDRRLRRLRRLFVHLVLTIILALGITYLSNLDRFSFSTPGGEVDIRSAADTIIPVVVLVFISHALWVMYQEARNFIVQQEMVRQATGLLEKPKRDEHLLDDDSELVEIFIEDEPHEKQKQAE